MLLKNSELEAQDEEELLDLLVEQPIAIDVDKQEAQKMSFGDRAADKVSEIAGSWAFVLGFLLFLISILFVSKPSEVTFIINGLFFFNSCSFS